MTAKISSIQIGMPRAFEAAKPWTSGFLKESVTEPIWLGTTNLEGDGQADLTHHGGPHKAICVYPSAHYPFWRETLGKPELNGGDFGENCTVDGLTEGDVCIGDVWAIGEVSVEVSQPRQPCWKLARRWNIKDLALRVEQTGRTGWYFRVLVTGFVQCGMSIELVDRPNPQWTIAAANQLMHHDKRNLAAAARLATIASLSPSWKATLSKRAEQAIEADQKKRLEGEDT